MPQQDAPKFNLPKWMEDNLPAGTSFTGVNPDGTANVAVPTPDGGSKASKLNVNSIMKDLGLDPSKHPVQYNTSMNPTDENAVGFKDGVGMALADPKHQEMFLRGKYGDQNVQKTEDGFVVNENGTWKKANPSFLSEVGANTPEMAGAAVGGTAGSMIGAFVGGVAGSVIPGAGTLGGIAAGSSVGGFLGSAIGGALAHVVKNKGVEALNMRTESDGKAADGEFSKELVNNMIWQTVLPGVGVVAKEGAGLVGGAAKRVGNIVSKDGLAWLGEKLMYGTQRADWRTVVRSAEDSRAVQNGIQEMIQWDKGTAGQVSQGADPMTKKITTTMLGFLQTAKKAAMDNFGAGTKALEDSGATNTQIKATEPIANFYNKLSSLGLIKNGEFNRTPGEGNEIMQVFDNKSLATLQKVFNQSKAVLTQKGNNISFPDAQRMLGGIDDILESSGYYKNGEAAMSNNARRALMQLRQELHGAMVEGLDSSGKQINGQNAGQFFKKVAADYSQFRSVYDDFAPKFDGDTRQVVSTVQRMLGGDKGVGLEENFQKLARSVGKDAEPTLQKLQQWRAAKNLSKDYSPQPGPLNYIRETLTGGPNTFAKNMSRITQTKESFQEGVLGKMAIGTATKATVGAKALALSTWQSMPQEAREQLLTNPTAIKYFGESIANAPQMQQGLFQQFMQHATNQAQQPPQQ